MRTLCLPAPSSDGGQHLEVEDGVVERDGDGLLRLELDRGAKLLGVDDRELHRADDDLLVGHAERETLAREAALFPEALELGGKSVDVDDLAFEDEAFRQRTHGDLSQGVPLTGSPHLRACDRRLFKVDPDAHTTLGHSSPFACRATL